MVQPLSLNTFRVFTVKFVGIKKCRNFTVETHLFPTGSLDSVSNSSSFNFFFLSISSYSFLLFFSKSEIQIIFFFFFLRFS